MTTEFKFVCREVDGGVCIGRTPEDIIVALPESEIEDYARRMAATEKQSAEWEGFDISEEKLTALLVEGYRRLRSERGV